MSSKKELRFEDAFKRLEEVVTKLEDGRISLDDSLKLFEEGIGLSRFCSKKLEEAKKKVEILVHDEKAGVVTKPFEMDAGPDNEPEREEDEDSS